MINGKTVLGVIPARGGSKGIPRKNVLDISGKPLIAWTIEAGHQSSYIDRLILSSDDDEIMKVAASCGCDIPFVRPAELATDLTPGIEPVLHAIAELPDYDYLVLLQPTSPLRTAEDIDRCIETCLSSKAPACVSVVQLDKSPQWMYSLDDSWRMTSMFGNRPLLERRQDSETVYVLNGAVYVAEVEYLRSQHSFITSKTVAYPMIKERSVDIDSWWDWRLAEWLLRERMETSG